MGKIKNLLAAAIFVLVSVANVSATAVAFQLIQHDPVQDKVRSSSYIIENGLFDYFFDKGFIVTNSPTSVSSDSVQDEEIYYTALSDASAGYCDYFIVISIDYNTENSRNPDAMILSNIEKVNWSVFDLETGKKIGSGSRKIGRIDPVKDNEKGISAFTAQVANDIFSFFKKKS